MDNKNNNKRGDIIVIRLLIIFIALIVGFNFVLYDPVFKITESTIVCLLILTALAFANIFDNITISKYFSVSKNIKKLEKENNELKETNLKLIEQIVTITNNINVTNNIYNGADVTDSSNNIESIGDKVAEEEPLLEKTDDKNRKHMKIQRFSENEMDSNVNYREYMNKLKSIAEIVLLKKELSSNSSDNILYNVKLTPTVEKIMNRPAEFDAMINEENKTVFYEVKLRPLSTFSYQLYYMLETLELYKKNNRPCELILVIPKPDKELEEILAEKTSYSNFKDRISSKFRIAIDKGLLKIKEVPISYKEIESYLEKKEN